MFNIGEGARREREGLPEGEAQHHQPGYLYTWGGSRSGYNLGLSPDLLMGQRETPHIPASELHMVWLPSTRRLSTKDSPCSHPPTASECGLDHT